MHHTCAFIISASLTADSAWLTTDIGRLVRAIVIEAPARI